MNEANKNKRFCMLECWDLGIQQPSTMPCLLESSGNSCQSSCCLSPQQRSILCIIFSTSEKAGTSVQCPGTTVHHSRSKKVCALPSLHATRHNAEAPALALQLEEAERTRTYAPFLQFLHTRRGTLVCRRATSRRTRTHMRYMNMKLRTSATWFQALASTARGCPAPCLRRCSSAFPTTTSSLVWVLRHRTGCIAEWSSARHRWSIIHREPPPTPHCIRVYCLRRQSKQLPTFCRGRRNGGTTVLTPRKARRRRWPARLAPRRNLCHGRNCTRCRG